MMIEAIIFIICVSILWIMFQLTRKDLYIDINTNLDNLSVDLSKDKDKNENKNTIIHFLDIQEIIKFIKDDEDKYIRRLKYLDLVARKCLSPESYKNKIVSALIKEHIDGIHIFVNIPLQKRVKNACNNAQQFFKIHHKQTKLYTHHILDIPWKIALVSTDLYEEGIPHTRRSVIFLCINRIKNMNDKELTSLLIHEKVHIFQRNYPDVDMIFDLGFRKITSRDSDMFIRSNPDLDDYVYMDINNGKILVRKYRSLTPKGISDVYQSTQRNRLHDYEHPYEYIAYKIEKEYEKINL